MDSDGVSAVRPPRRRSSDAPVPARRASRAKPAAVRRSGAARVLDRFECYERCVQDGARMAAFLRAVHGGEARVLREDFCGTGAVCRAWVSDASAMGDSAGRRAIGVDLDREPLERLWRVPRVQAVCADVVRCDLKADIISATNFPIGYWHTRPELLRYLRATRARLRRGGVFVCDTYGGTGAFTRGSTVRDIYADGGLRIRYTWEQREADPISGLVTDVLHFRGDRAGEVVFTHTDAFTYRWRLWSLPELRDALLEAGFAQVEVYSELADAIDQDGRVYVRPVTHPDELDETFFVCVVART